jgi:hypothetical protein
MPNCHRASWTPGLCSAWCPVPSTALWRWRAASARQAGIASVPPDVPFPRRPCGDGARRLHVKQAPCLAVPQPFRLQPLWWTSSPKKCGLRWIWISLMTMILLIGLTTLSSTVWIIGKPNYVVFFGRDFGVSFDGSKPPLSIVWIISKANHVVFVKRFWEIIDNQIMFSSTIGITGTQIHCVLFEGILENNIEDYNLQIKSHGNMGLH